MKIILYVVSTLGTSGPTNQLFNLIKYLDKKKFELHLITLSPEPVDSRRHDYAALGVMLHSLGLSRVKGFFGSKGKVKALIKSIEPDLIHTQGIRADSLLANVDIAVPHVMTIHNYAPDDYISKFGKFKGSLMVHQHFKVMRNSQYLIACSKTIQRKLNSVGIESIAIQNGVEIEVDDAIVSAFVESLPKPVFISVGSLIPRKNMQLIIDAFNKLSADKKGSLVILGDGPLKVELVNQSGEQVHLLGNITNVPCYLAAADYFVSASLSEGLPNTVLEALAAGLPVILSDIDSHKEIAQESSLACMLFPLSDGVQVLTQAFTMVSERFNDESAVDAKRIANCIFSAQKMSLKYQEFYQNILG